MINALKNHEQLDLIISHLNNNQSKTFAWDEIKHNLFNDNDSINRDIIKQWVEYIANSGLVTKGQIRGAGDDSNLVTTIKWSGVIPGFIKSGGFNKQHKDLEAEKTKQEEIREIELEKLKYDTKLSKWQVKVFWWVFFAGFIGGLMGVISLTLELEDRGYIRLPIELRESKVEQNRTLESSIRNPTLPEINDSL